MGFTSGRWVSDKAPNQIDYPFEIAAKMTSVIRSCSHDEICHFVDTTRKFYDLCREQDALIRTLEKKLIASEENVRMLQVSDY